MSLPVASFEPQAKFVKGVFGAQAYEVGSRNLVFYSRLLSENSFTTSVNLNPLQGGIGNNTIIQIPDTAAINVTLTTQDVDMSSRALQTGGIIGYNGITQTCEPVISSGGLLTVKQGIPVAPYGGNQVVCYVGSDGTAREVDPITGVVQDFVPVDGQQYSVRYYVSKVASEVMTMASVFVPSIVTLEVTMPVYAVPAANDPISSTEIGVWHYVIPRFQFNGEATLTANQTTYGTSSISGTALRYDEAADDVCPASGGAGILGYMIFEPKLSTIGAQAIVVPGGSIMVPEGGSVLAPIKFIMQNGQLAQPNMADLEFLMSDPAVATIAANGVINGLTAGDTSLTITLASPPLTCVTDVTVTPA